MADPRRRDASHARVRAAPARTGKEPRQVAIAVGLAFLAGVAAIVLMVAAPDGQAGPAEGVAAEADPPTVLDGSAVPPGLLPAPGGLPDPDDLLNGTSGPPFLPAPLPVSAVPPGP